MTAGASTKSATSALVRHTPLVVAPALGERLNADVRLKLECLQRTGSFKLRGAARRLDSLSQVERARGVIAASAGNHGLGVALAGSHLAIPTEIVVPETSPAVKRRGIEACGASVVVHGASYDAAEVFAKKRARDRDQVFVSPFDDDDVIAGNGGSLGEEIADAVDGLAAVICPVGGGGLVGGLAQALAPRGVRVMGVQPRKNCAMFKSLELGRALVQYHEGEKTLAEGCEGAVCERTFELCRKNGVAIELVSETAIEHAVAWAYRQLGVAIEASSAVPLAALLAGAITPPAAGVTVLILTGSNIEPTLLDALLGRYTDEN